MMGNFEHDGATTAVAKSNYESFTSSEPEVTGSQDARGQIVNRDNLEKQRLDRKDKSAIAELRRKLKAVEKELAEVLEKGRRANENLNRIQQKLEDAGRVSADEVTLSSSQRFYLEATKFVLSNRLKSTGFLLSNPLIRFVQKISNALGSLKATAALPNRIKLEPKHVELIEQSGLFDRTYYSVMNPDVVDAKLDLVVHFLAFGAEEGRDPHPLFSIRHYRKQVSELAQENPLIHYLTKGAKEFNPHPLFNTKYYLASSPAAHSNPLGHFLTASAKDPSNPHCLFDTKFYLKEYPDVAASGLNPLLHYVVIGAYEGRKPHPLFDPNFYFRDQRGSFLPRFPLLSEESVSVLESIYAHCWLVRPDEYANRANPLIHFLEVGSKSKQDPHPLFSTRFYLNQYEDVKSPSTSPFLHYVERGKAELRQPHPLFDPRYYLIQFPGLEESETDPLTHFVTVGGTKGANPNKHFDSAFYSSSYADVKPSGLIPVVHYALKGEREGKQPNRYFDPVFYNAINEDVAQSGLDPFTHYLLRGEIEGRLINRNDYERQKQRTDVKSVATSTDKTQEVLSFPNPAASPMVSIIIPIYGKIDYTLACLTSLSQHETRYSFEVIVVDDCSPDNSCERLMQVPGLKVIRREKNGGFVLSCNRGAEIARGKYLVFLNNDTEVTPFWLDELYRDFQQAS
jgi:hypothetical protein